MSEEITEAYLDHLIELGEEIEMEYSEYLAQQSEESYMSDMIARGEAYEIEKQYRDYQDYLAPTIKPLFKKHPRKHKEVTPPFFFSNRNGRSTGYRSSSSGSSKDKAG